VSISKEDTEMTNTETNAAILLKATLSFMARKANVTEQEILNTMATDPHGATTRYFAQLIAIGIPAITAA
jgi:hypothetical protein